MTTASTSTFVGLPALGVGMGWRLPYARAIWEQADHIDFLEITADHFLEMPRAQEVQLERLLERFKLIPHGLSLSLGSAEGLNRPYLRQLRDLVRRVKPSWWSEHISFTQAAGVEIGHLSPVPFHRETLKVLAENIRIAQEEIEVPLILENITYSVQLPFNELQEEEFLAELLERTDTGLLLDVTNLYTNSVNHGYDPVEWLRSLPVDRVVQLHYVGGEWADGTLVDNHSHDTPEEVWALMETVLKRFPVKGAILERDDNLPPLKELVGELDRARAIGRETGRWN